MSDELSLEGMRSAIAAMLGADTVADDADLLRLGMDSIQVIRLASRWRRAGADVTFAELVEYRTLAEWFELVSSKVASNVAGPVVPAEPEVDESQPFDLATMQHAYWVGRDREQVLGGVGAQFYCEFDGTGVDPARLEQAVRALIARHGMLRARFLDDGRQQIMDDSPWPGVTVHDLRDDPARADQVRAELSHRKMAVERGEIFDIHLSLLPGGLTRLHLAIEMLVSDAQSFQILLDDLARLYRDPGTPLPPLGYSFPRYLAGQESRRARKRAEDRAWWMERLPDLPGAPQLPLATPPERIEQRHNVRLSHSLSSEEWKRLTECAREHSVLLSMVFVTAFAEVVGAWSDSRRFLLNLPFYDRDEVHQDVNRIVGDFTNLVLLGVDVSEPLPFIERVRDVQSRFHRDLAHASFTGVEVMRELARANPDAGPVAPVVFTTAINLGELFTQEFRDSFGTPGYTMSTTPQVWLDCQVTERGGGLFVNWDAVEELFPAGVLDGMFEAYVGIVRKLVAGEWSEPVGGLVPAGQLAVRAGVNATAGAVSGRLLHAGFFEWAGREPGRVALLWDGGSLSYGELAGRALAVAGWLRGGGVAPGGLVGVSVRRGPDQVAAVLGVLAAGAAYVPVGVDQPEVRRERIFASAGVSCVLTDEVMAEALAASPVGVPVWADGLAYVIYTSGSTGEPKGVEITHAAAVNTVEDVVGRFGVSGGDRVLAVSALDFDLSVFDVFGLLSVGGSLVLIGEEDRREAGRWAQLCERFGVSVWNSVPALLDMLLTVGGGGGLRLALVSGDWVGLDLSARLAAVAPGAELVALGGATEAAIWSNFMPVPVRVPRGWVSVPYGRPLRNQRFRVVDGRGRDCPDWVPGELWIGGAGVALGYRNDPERTAAQFVTVGGERWYRTGDVGRYWPDGVLEFLGRRDFQVKVRGHRIELGEVEAVLEACPGVSRAVAAAVEVSGGRSRRLAALVVGGQAERVREFAASRLPGYMVPERVVVVEALPLSGNGKIDRAAALRLLVEADTGEAGGGSSPPRGPVETVLAGLWADLLSVAVISREDNFFALGGDSLLATRLLAKLRAAGYEGASMRSLFANPVLQDFAALLTAGTAETAVVLRPDPAHRHEPFPPTDVQRAYWVGRTDTFTLGGVGSHWYWEVDGTGVDLPGLETAWNRLVARHEMLRAVFDDDGDQRILPEVPHTVIQVTDTAEQDYERELDRLREDLSHRIADPGRWPLVEVRAVRSGGRTRLAFSFDYMVLDALSIVTVFKELAALYREPELALPALEVSFRDYLCQAVPGEAERRAAEDYWRERAAALPPAPRLPLAKDPAKVTSPRFTRREAKLEPHEWAALVEQARAHGLTPAAVLATAYAEVLSAWSEGDGLTLNLTLFDRREVHPQINEVLGDFTSLLLAAYEPGPGEDFAAAARRYQERMWADMEHRAVSAIWVLRERARQTGAADVSMPVVFTSALGLPAELVELDLPFGRPGWGLSQTPQVWLDCQVTERGGGLFVNWDAVEELFPAGVLDGMFEAYVGIVRKLVAGEWSEPVGGLVPAGQLAVRAGVNATAGAVSGRLLHAGFFEWAGREPGRVALLWDGGSLSYGELAGRALAVAGWLRGGGVAPGGLVGVSVRRGPDQVAAVLGVLAAGAAYVPVGVDQPEVRRERIFASAGVSCVLTDEVMAEALAASPVGVPVWADGLAYVIYTSGSTGEPKGVEITHAAAVNTVEDVVGRFGVSGGDRVLAVSALDFDLSVFDVFGLLSVGGSLVLIGEEDRREAGRWAQLCERFGVSVWNSVPALLDMLLTVGGGGGLRLALVSGDWVGLDLSARLAAVAPGAELVALGGATEAAIWSNFMPVPVRVPRGWVSVPYGRPLRNQRFRVVDGRGRDCPDWVPGELWIGGAGVALGYRNDPERTAAQFVTVGGERWYRTGDVGRYWPDGVLEFLGRRDFQVKVRGHRIELGEVEAVLEACPGVSRAVAAAVEVSGGRSRRLAALVVGGQAERVREFAASRLPGYMVPERVVVVEALPLSGNGKIDRAAALRLLAEADTGEAGGGSSPPRGPVETALAGLWADLLSVAVISREDNFFALGGDSLLATRLVEAVRREFGVVMTLRLLLGVPTLAELAALIEAQTADAVEEGEV